MHNGLKLLVHDERLAGTATTRSMAGLTQENSEWIGFLLSCLFAGAISTAECRQWARKVLEETDGAPPYLNDLTAFKGPLFHIYNVIGFAPRWLHTEHDTLAISGIAFRRNCQPFEHPKIREEALRKLKQNPEIEKRFRSEFSFLDW